MNNFAENLKQLRIANKLSQSEFAKKIGTTQQRVNEWECGKIEPTLSNIVKILKTLGITFEDLIE